MSRLAFYFYKIRFNWEYICVNLYIFWENYDIILIQLIEKVQSIIQNIFTTLVRNSFDEWVEKNCKLKRQLSLQEAEEFCNIIIKNKHNYIFFPTIDLNDFFSELKVECETIYLVENKYINDFADEWTNINNNRMELKMPFLQFVLSKINDMYVYDSDDDLPF